MNRRKKTGMMFAAVFLTAALLFSAGGQVFASMGTATARRETDLELGKRYQERGEYEKAAGCYQKALLKDPADTEAILALMETYGAQEKYDDILMLCDSRKSYLGEEEENMLLQRAQELLTQGAELARAKQDTEEAIRLYETVLKTALQESDARIQADAQLPALYLERARETTRKQWQQVLEVSPDHVQALTILADLAYTEAEYEEALSCYMRAYEKGGDAFVLKRRITETYLAIAQAAPQSKAEDAWKDLLAWSPKNVEGFTGLAEYYLSLEDEESALAVLEEGLNLTGSPALQAMYDDLYVTDFEKLVRQIVEEETTPEMTHAQKRRALYDYVLRRATYVRTYDEPEGAWTKSYAMDIYARGTGNCYRYAAAFAYLCREIGDDVCVCTGTISAARGGVTPHGWVEITEGNKTYICDPDMEQAKGGDYYMKTFEQYPVKPLNKEAEWEITF